MSPLAAVVLLAELGVVGVFALYIGALVSMHREARTMAQPRLDPVSRSLLAAARYGLWMGIAAVGALSIFYGGLT